MTWVAAVYALLALVLVGGFAWYERSRPPARMVALVAALAALAIAGRLAFAAIPNVVATTDIVLITGFSVGAAPGFAVGALAAVVSNLWLGQGPWTPWQMAAWGLVGVAGAALAIATGRRLGRFGLAVACGVAGLAYGALLDLSVMVTYGGEQSLDRYLAISSRGVPFNVAHAVGNVALALAAGPTLVRIISRYRSRFEFTWREAGAVPLAILAAAVLWLPVAGAGTTATAAGGGGGAARDWLERAQNADGGFGTEPGEDSSVAMTGWAVLGLEAAGRNPLDVRNGGSSALGYLRANVASIRSTGDLERTILVLAGAGANPHRFGGRDLVAELRDRRSPKGSFGGQVNLTAFGILALRAGGAPPSAVGRSAAWLRDAQGSDGGWGFQRQAASDADSTGAALQGLAAGDRRGAAVRHGSAYLRRVQGHDGGFALAGSSGSNTQSTAWAVQGLIAAGANPAAVRKRGRSPLEYLADRQANDGHYRYSSSSDQTPIWVTGQALAAVSRKAFPLAAVPRSSPRASSRPENEPKSHAAAGGARDGEAASPSAYKASSPASGRARTGGSGGGGAPSARPRKRHDGARSQDGGTEANRARTPSATPIVPTAAPSGGGEGGLGTAAYVGAGFGFATAALVAGFLWYRRRLP